MPRLADATDPARFDAKVFTCTFQGPPRYAEAIGIAVDLSHRLGAKRKFHPQEIGGLV
jgi:hypothetical protein